MAQSYGKAVHFQSVLKICQSQLKNKMKIKGGTASWSHVVIRKPHG